MDVALQKEELRALVQRADVIFHLAAAVGVELVVNDPVRTIETNIDGSANVVKLASEYGKRLFLASTSEVYGKSSKEEFSGERSFPLSSFFFFLNENRVTYLCI